MKVYNTPQKSLQEFRPLNPDVVTVYTCGPTVYDYPHIGNWFSFVRYDLLVRSLRVLGYNPKWVMNITDVGHLVSDADEGEDKLEKGARREGKTAWEVAAFYSDYFIEGMDRLNMTRPDELPRATDHIPEQIDLIKRLEEKGFTYTIDDGVYFDTSKFPHYGDFAGLHLEAQKEGARIAANQQKRNPSDFALWKFSPAGKRRDMEWDSPWGKGFPGWHIECSAMSMKYLGATIDIHGGGIDHIPVHHTNEIAQSEAATGKQFVRYWFHSNHITVNDEKIAKSAGNSITLEDVTAKGFSPIDLRMLIIESNYRTQSKFSWETLEAAHNRLLSLQSTADLRYQLDKSAAVLGRPYFQDLRQKVLTALEHDLNTPEVLKLLGEMVQHFETHSYGLHPDDCQGFVVFLEFIDDALGLGLSQRADITAKQRQLLTERAHARDKKSWKQSDAIREQLHNEGIGIQDLSNRQIWYRI